MRNAYCDIAVVGDFSHPSMGELTERSSMTPFKNKLNSLDAEAREDDTMCLLSPHPIPPE